MATQGLPPARAAHLVDLYGAPAATVADFCNQTADQPLPGVRMTAAGVIWAVQHEQALHLADVLQRCSPMAIRGLLSPALVTAVAGVMARACGWSEERTHDEIARFHSDLATWHGVTLSAPEGATP